MASIVAPPESRSAQEGVLAIRDESLGRSLNAACIASLAIGLIALAAPLFLGAVSTRDDLGEFHLPVRQFYARQLAADEPFDWMPSLFGGFFVTGEGQLGGYHPLHLLLYRYLPLEQAYGLEAWLSYPFLSLGLFVWLRQLLTRSVSNHDPVAARSAALLGATTGCFGSFFLLHYVHPNAVAVMAHLPWMLWAAGIVLVDIRPRMKGAGCLTLSLCVGSQLLLGYPQYVWFSQLALWFVVVVTLLRPGTFTRWSSGLLIVSSLVAGAMLGSCQVWPTVAALGESTRQNFDMGLASSGSLAPLNLVQLAAPYLFESRVVGANTHELGMYLGAVPLALLVYLFMQASCWGGPGWGDYSPIVKLSFAAAIVSALYAFGDFGPLYRLQLSLPFVNRFRFSCRAIVLFQLALLPAVAVAWSMLIADAKRHLRNEGAQIESRQYPASKLSAIAIGVASLSVVLLAAPLWPEHLAGFWQLALGPLLMTAAGLTVYWAGRGSLIAIVLIVPLAVADLAIYGMSYALWNHVQPLERFAAESPRPPDLVGRVVFDPVNVDGKTPAIRHGNRCLLAGVSRADGYAGLEPRSGQCLPLLADLQARGVRWVFRSRAAEQIEGLQPYNEQWLQTPQPQARALWLPESAAKTLSFERVPAGLGSGAVLNVAVDIPGNLVINLPEAAQRGIVATTESFHPDWRATLNGRAVPIIRLEADRLGCQVDGNGRLRLHFESRSVQYGGWLASCGLVLTIGLALVTAFGRKAKPQPARTVRYESAATDT